jgi:hypothetical protein
MLLKNFQVIYSGNSRGGYLVQKTYRFDRPMTVRQYRNYEAACADAEARQKELNKLRRTKRIIPAVGAAI